MDDKLKAELSKLFEKDEERVVAVQRATDEQKVREAASLAEFERIRDQIVKPAMAEVSELVRQHGWQSAISTRNDEEHPDGRREPAAITIAFARGAPPRSHDHQVPHFSVVCDKRGDGVNFHESTIGQGHGGSSSSSGSAKLHEITGELIQARLVKYLGKLLNDAKPFASR
jgi:hypothetical protein